MVNHVTKSIFFFSIISLFIVACTTSTPVLPPDPPPIVEHLPPPLELPKALPVMQPCPDDMVFIPEGHFCIDTYEAPNQKGAYPLYAQTAYQGEVYCQQQNKQLCTNSRWMQACMGPNHKTYPYGNVYHRGTCNDDKVGWTPVPWLTMGTPAWNKWCQAHYKGEPSGSHNTCMSDYGVFDLTGNVAEWVREPKVQYRYVVKGGYWYGVLVGTPTCGFSNIGHSPLFNSYEFGFRCCKDTD